MKIENVEFENTPTLVIVRGIPGSGKSTFAEYCVKKLAEEHITATHCESDDYWMRNGVYKFDARFLHMAHKWCFKKVFESFKNSKIVFVTNTFTTMKELNTYLKEAAQRGLKVTVVRMANEFQNQHEVPELTLEAMRNRFCDYPGEVIVKNNSLDQFTPNSKFIIL